MRRIVGLGLAAAVLAGVAGCGGSGSDGDEVTLWMFPVILDEAAGAQFWQQVEKDFEAANPGVDAKIELQPWEDRQEKITTALAAGTGFDLVVLGPDQIPQYVEQGTLAPVTDVLAAERDSFVPTALDALTVEGELYGVPFYHTSTLPVYNKELLDKAGVTDVPDTWDELKAAAPKLAAQDVATIQYAGDPKESLNLTYYPFLWQNGGQVFSPDGKSVAFNDAKGVEALQFLMDLNQLGGLPQGAATQTSALEGSPMATGKAAMMPIVQSSQLAPLGAALGAENLVVGQPIMGEKRVSFGMPGAVALSQRSENTTAAKKLMAYLASPKVVGDLAKASGFMSPRTDVEADAADPNAKLFTEALPLLYGGDSHPKARQVMSVLSPQIQAALQGKKTAQQALDDAAAEADALLA